MSTLETRKETTQDRILTIFQGHARPLMGEEVVVLFEEKFGRNGTSDVVRTGVSALTRKGELREAGEVVSPTTHEPVKTWVINDGTVTVQPVVKTKPSYSQLLEELNTLKLRYTNLEQSNTKLYSIIEELRAGGK